MSDYEGPPAKISKTTVVYSDKLAESEEVCSQDELVDQEEWLTEGTNNTDEDYSYQLKSAASSVSSQDGGSQSMVEVPDEAGDLGSDAGPVTVGHDTDNAPTDPVTTEDDTVELPITKATEDTTETSRTIKSTKTTATTNSTELTELPENYLEDAADDVEKSIKTTRIFKSVSKNGTSTAGNNEEFNCKSAIALKVTESLPEKILNYQDSTEPIISSKSKKEKENESQYESEMSKFIMKWQDDATSSGSNDNSEAKCDKKSKEKKSEGEEKGDDGNDTDGLLRMLEGDNKTPETKVEKKRKEEAKSQKEAAAEVDSDEENDTKRSVRKMLINGRQKKVLEESSDSEAETEAGAHENSKDQKFPWKKSQGKHVAIVRKPSNQIQQAQKPVRAYTRSNARIDANKNVAISNTQSPRLSKKDIAVTLNTIIRSKSGDGVTRPKTVSDLKRSAVEIKKVPTPTVVISKPKTPNVVIAKAKTPHVVVTKEKTPNVVMAKEKMPNVVMGKEKTPNVGVTRPMIVTRSNSRSSTDASRNDSKIKNSAPKTTVATSSPVFNTRSSLANPVSKTNSANKPNSDATRSMANSVSPKTYSNNKLATPVDSGKKIVWSNSVKKSGSAMTDSVKSAVSATPNSVKKTVNFAPSVFSKRAEGETEEESKKREESMDDGDDFLNDQDFNDALKDKMGFLHDSSLSDQSSDDLSLEGTSCSDSEGAVEAGFKIDLRNEKASDVLPLLGQQAELLLRTESRDLDQTIRLLAARRSEVVAKVKAQNSFIRSLESRLEQLTDRFGVES